MVREFHAKFGFTTNDRPTLLDEELFKVRHTHTLSELGELWDAYYIEKDLSKIADAIGDAVYFLKGTANAFGIDLEPIFEEIHRSNMTKTKPEGDAKAIKGPGYSPPDLQAIIVKQMDAIPPGKVYMCDCGMYYQHSRLDAEAHAKVEGHKLTLVDR